MRAHRSPVPRGCRASLWWIALILVALGVLCAGRCSDVASAQKPVDRPPSLRVGEPPRVGERCWPERAERRTATGVTAVCRRDVRDGELRWALP